MASAPGTLGNLRADRDAIVEFSCRPCRSALPSVDDPSKPRQERRRRPARKGRRNAMKFLMTYEPKVKEPPTPEKMARLGKFTQESAKAGILLMTGGLQRPTKGTRLTLSDGNFTIDGPYAE